MDFDSTHFQSQEVEKYILEFQGKTFIQEQGFDPLFNNNMVCVGKGIYQSMLPSIRDKKVGICFSHLVVAQCKKAKVDARDVPSEHRLAQRYKMTVPNPRPNKYPPIQFYEKAEYEETRRKKRECRKRSRRAGPFLPEQLSGGGFKFCNSSQTSPTQSVGRRATEIVVGHGKDLIITKDRPTSKSN
ncbi:hypothetical protein Gorai_023214 [Gossypium raimondii]|uniref:Uncharacterized protein n=1 Tax=Gossypium raimondii TaxID=29730 RepID=A0A7J8NVF8_GOSRA|nr:hypothetical protein [Gossypium raimondii]